jgi:hypothetical protein
MRRLYAAVAVHFVVEYDDTKLSLQELQSQLLDATSIAGWTIQETTTESLGANMENVVHVHTNIDEGNMLLEDYPALDTNYPYIPKHDPIVSTSDAIVLVD